MFSPEFYQLLHTINDSENSKLNRARLFKSLNVSEIAWLQERFKALPFNHRIRDFFVIHDKLGLASPITWSLCKIIAVLYGLACGFTTVGAMFFLTQSMPIIVPIILYPAILIHSTRMNIRFAWNSVSRTFIKILFFMSSMLLHYTPDDLKNTLLSLDKAYRKLFEAYTNSKSRATALRDVISLQYKILEFEASLNMRITNTELEANVIQLKNLVFLAQQQFDSIRQYDTHERVIKKHELSFLKERLSRMMFIKKNRNSKQDIVEPIAHPPIELLPDQKGSIYPIADVSISLAKLREITKHLQISKATIHSEFEINYILHVRFNLTEAEATEVKTFFSDHHLDSLVTPNDLDDERKQRYLNSAAAPIHWVKRLIICLGLVFAIGGGVAYSGLTFFGTLKVFSEIGTMKAFSALAGASAIITPIAVLMAVVATAVLIAVLYVNITARVRMISADDLRDFAYYFTWTGLKTLCTKENFIKLIFHTLALYGLYCVFLEANKQFGNLAKYVGISAYPAIILSNIVVFLLALPMRVLFTVRITRDTLIREEDRLQKTWNQFINSEAAQGFIAFHKRLSGVALVTAIALDCIMLPLLFIFSIVRITINFLLSSHEMNSGGNGGLAADGKYRAETNNHTTKINPMGVFLVILAFLTSALISYAAFIDIVSGANKPLLTKAKPKSNSIIPTFKTVADACDLPFYSNSQEEDIARERLMTAYHPTFFATATESHSSNKKALPLLKIPQQPPSSSHQAVASR